MSWPDINIELGTTDPDDKVRGFSMEVDYFVFKSFT